MPCTCDKCLLSSCVCITCINSGNICSRFLYSINAFVCIISLCATKNRLQSTINASLGQPRTFFVFFFRCRTPCYSGFASICRWVVENGSTFWKGLNRSPCMLLHFLSRSLWLGLDNWTGFKTMVVTYKNLNKHFTTTKLYHPNTYFASYAVISEAT